MSKPQVYECIERQTVSVPIQEVLAADGQVDVLPSVVSKGYFDIDFTGGKLVLKAGRYVGLIPLNERVVINVRPKVATNALLRILNVAQAQIGALPFFERFYQEAGRPNESLVPLLVRSLLRELQTVAQEGTYKEYARREVAGQFKPRIQFARSIQRYWSRGDTTKACSVYFELSKDNPANQLVKFALWYCGRYCELLGKTDSTLLEELNFFYNLFETVPLDSSRSFLPAAVDAVQKLRFPAIRSYYVELLKVCLLIVGNRSIDLESPKQHISLLSFILNLDDVFESYVRNLLQEALPKFDPNLTVANGNREAAGFLFYDSKAMRVTPDIVLQKDGKALVVADVKYKLKFHEDDRYQMICHGLCYGVRKALLIKPTYEGPERVQRGLVRLGQVHDEQGIELFEYHLKLDEDLPAEEQRLAEAVTDLLRERT